MVNPGLEIRSCRIAATQPGYTKSHIISLSSTVMHIWKPIFFTVVEQSVYQFPCPDAYRDKKCYGAADKIHKVR
jgi:presenilin-like A22 family membrane protease